jgi:ABC-type glycerol-3-phosphate transport system substrate-binding protein
MAGPAPSHERSRRGFLELAALGTVGAIIGPRQAPAATKSLTILHGSSFIKTFDEYFQKTLAPTYEKETGIKVNYELTSIGSVSTRISTITEAGSGADITMTFRLWRKFCAGGHAGAVVPVGGGMKRPGRRTVRPPCGRRLRSRPAAVASCS